LKTLDWRVAAEATWGHPGGPRLAAGIWTISRWASGGALAIADAPSDVARAWHLCRELAALLGRPLEDLPPLLEKVVAADRRPSPGASPHCGGKAAMHGAPGRAVSHLRKFRRCEARLGPSCGVSAAGGAIAPWR